MPNSLLNEQPVTNRSAQDELRQTFRFGVAYDENLERAMEATLVAAREVEGIAEEPVPEVRAVRAALMENDIDINPEKTEISGRIGTAEIDSHGAVLERERN